MGRTIGCIPALEAFMVASGARKLILRDKAFWSVLDWVQWTLCLKHLMFSSIGNYLPPLEGSLLDNPKQYLKIELAMAGIGVFFRLSMALRGSIVSPDEKFSFKSCIYMYTQTYMIFKYFNIHG